MFRRRQRHHIRLTGKFADENSAVVADEHDQHEQRRGEQPVDEHVYAGNQIGPRPHAEPRKRHEARDRLAGERDQPARRHDRLDLGNSVDPRR